MSFKDLGFAIDVLIVAIVLVVIILFLGIAVFFISVLVCIVARAFRSGGGNDIVIERESNGTARTSQDDLEKLPCYNFVAKDEENSVNCAVCLDNLEDDDKCRMLPMCKHSFHAKCVDAWLLQTPICPICRTRALIISEESSNLSDTSIEIRGSQTTESSQFSDASISMQLREGLLTESSQLMSTITIDVRESRARESIIELGENQEENNQSIIARIESTQTQLTTVPVRDPTYEPPA